MFATKWGTYVVKSFMTWYYNIAFIEHYGVNEMAKPMCISIRIAVWVLLTLGMVAFKILSSRKV